MTYYNTTHQAGEQLKKYQDQTIKQEERLLMFFQDHSDQRFTRAELHKLILQEAPVSSITRGLANLKKQGSIVRTEEQKSGDYGRPQHCWQLAPKDEPHQRRLL